MSGSKAARFSSEWIGKEQKTLVVYHETSLPKHLCIWLGRLSCPNGLKQLKMTQGHSVIFVPGSLRRDPSKKMGVAKVGRHLAVLLGNLCAWLSRSTSTSSHLAAFFCLISWCVCLISLDPTLFQPVVSSC